MSLRLWPILLSVVLLSACYLRSINRRPPVDFAPAVTEETARKAVVAVLKEEGYLVESFAVDGIFRSLPQVFSRKFYKEGIKERLVVNGLVSKREVVRLRLIVEGVFWKHDAKEPPQPLPSHLDDTLDAESARLTGRIIERANSWKD